MDAYTHKKVFSSERMQKYFDIHHPNEEKGLLHYKMNIRVSEASYPLLSIFEVALRNSLNKELIKHFGTTDWFLCIEADPALKDLRSEIATAKRHIYKRGETITTSKVIGELTLGFWVRILNVEYELILWKSLRRAFPFMPKQDRKRHMVSSPLNRIRDFRNRVYHNEQISWRLDKVEEIHHVILIVLGWLNSELPEYVKSITRFDEVIVQARQELGFSA